MNDDDRSHRLVVVMCIGITAIALLILWAKIADAGGRTVTLTVPARAVVHVYPEADHTMSGIWWRCATSRTWRHPGVNGFRPGCGRIVITSRTTYYDVALDVPEPGL